MDISSNSLTLAISLALKRSRACSERSRTVLSRSRYRGDVACLHPIRGASEDDVIGAIEEFLSSTPSCIVCLVARTGLGAWDVEVAMRALIRTSDVELAGVCEWCRIRNAFRLRHRGRTDT